VTGTAGPLLGCIEGGGTKFVLGILTTDRHVLARHSIATGDGPDTIDAAIAWLRSQSMRLGPIAAIGIASFGPADVDPHSPHYGTITGTPKQGWRNVDMAGSFARAFGAPAAFDTDVNGAAMAESRWGAAVGQRIAAYVTVGTGIGAGVVVDGVPLRGLSHPEMGHILPRRHPDDRDFPGICAVHGDCLEGLASGPAIAARWGASLSDLPTDHPAHAITAFYIAQLCLSLQALCEPGRIVIGGGVSLTPHFHERMADETARLGAGYFRGKPQHIIVPPGLGINSGLMGAYALALDALGTVPS